MISWGKTEVLGLYFRYCGTIHLSPLASVVFVLRFFSLHRLKGRPKRLRVPMCPFISSLLPPSLFGGFRTGLTDDRGLRWCLNPDYKTQQAPSLQPNTTKTLTLQHLQVDADLHTDTNRHTWTFMTIPKYSQNIQPSPCCSVIHGWSMSVQLEYWGITLICCSQPKVIRLIQSPAAELAAALRGFLI